MLPQPVLSVYFRISCFLLKYMLTCHYNESIVIIKEFTQCPFRSVTSEVIHSAWPLNSVQSFLPIYLTFQWHLITYTSNLHAVTLNHLPWDMWRILNFYFYLLRLFIMYFSWCLTVWNIPLEKKMRWCEPQCLASSQRSPFHSFTRGR